jgi:hypothetical protein
VYPQVGPAAERLALWAAKSEIMSEDVDTLLAIAEIAGVFVGFAALLTFITRSAGANGRAASVFLLTNVILISVLVIVAALVPVVLNRYGLSQSIVWRVSSSALFVLAWLQILFVGRVTQGYRSGHSQRRVLSFAVWSLEPLFQIPLLMCIVGAWKSLAPAFYLTALVVALVQVSLIFADLVTVLLKTERA